MHVRAYYNISILQVEPEQPEEEPEPPAPEPAKPAAPKRIASRKNVKKPRREDRPDSISKS